MIQPLQICINSDNLVICSKEPITTNPSFSFSGFNNGFIEIQGVSRKKKWNNNRTLKYLDLLNLRILMSPDSRRLRKPLQKEMESESTLIPSTYRPSFNLLCPLWGGYKGSLVSDLCACSCPQQFADTLILQPSFIWKRNF